MAVYRIAVRATGWEQGEGANQWRWICGSDNQPVDYGDFLQAHQATRRLDRDRSIASQTVDVCVVLQLPWSKAAMWVSWSEQDGLLLRIWRLYQIYRDLRLAEAVYESK